jgi:hypothetical protein
MVVTITIDGDMLEPDPQASKKERPSMHHGLPLISPLRNHSMSRLHVAIFVLGIKMDAAVLVAALSILLYCVKCKSIYVTPLALHQCT